MTKTANTSSTREVFRSDSLEVEGGTIPVTMWKTSLYIADDHIQDTFTLEVDGVEWLKTKSVMHAAVLFEMMMEHVTEYMHYEVTA